jgi:protein-tyrosine-phosphatase
MTKKFNILFLCTHNSARSILAEAIATTHESGKFVGYSAGSSPGTSVNPIAAEMAIDMGLAPDKLRSKSWDEYELASAPHMDFIITVCDNAAGEVCPFWPGQPATAHWGFPDPSLVEGSEAVKKHAFREVMIGLKKRIDILASLPIDHLDLMATKDVLKNIHSEA